MTAPKPLMHMCNDIGPESCSHLNEARLYVRMCPVRRAISCNYVSLDEIVYEMEVARLRDRVVVVPVRKLPPYLFRHSAQVVQLLHMRGSKAQVSITS